MQRKYRPGDTRILHPGLETSEKGQTTIPEIIKMATMINQEDTT